MNRRSASASTLRRTLLLTVVTLGFSQFTCLSLWETQRSHAAQRGETPNIVVLYADDMGYGDLGVQNPESKIATPHLDQLAKDGLRLTNGHSSSGVCTPSRYALLTGRYHWRAFHDIVNSFDPSVFKAEQLTLPEMLKEKGYRTACIGKWHLGWNWDAIKRQDAKPKGRNGYAAADFDWTRPIPDGPLAHGFDYYFGDDVPNFPPYAWIDNDKIVEPPTVPYVAHPKPAEGAPEGRPGPMVAGWQQDAVMPTLTRKAAEWIAAQKSSGKPFFLYFPCTSPHAPIVPAAEFQGKSQAGGFGDFMQQTDWSCGQILHALDEHGFRDNTIVIFSSDNGPEGYAYARLQNFQHRSMGPLRGVKRDIYEGGHRVPLIVRWPGVVQPGRVSDALVSQIDLMATIAAIVDYKLPKSAGEDSYNQLPPLRGEIDSEAIRPALVHNTKANHYAIRSGDWVLIDAKSGAITAVPPWFDKAHGYAGNPHDAALYNLRDDLAQRENLLEKFPEKVAQLRKLLAEIRRGQVAPASRR